MRAEIQCTNVAITTHNRVIRRAVDTNSKYRNGRSFGRHLVAALIITMLQASAPAAGARNLLIQDVTLIDGTGNAPVSGISVLVTGDRIAQVQPQITDIPGDTIRIDASGKFLVPGLIDTHTHIPGGRYPEHGANQKLVRNEATGRRSLHGYIYSGVTSVYDAGNNPDYVFALRDAERSGTLTAPRIFATGAAVAPKDGYLSSGGGIQVSNYQDGISKLQALIANKPDLIKFSMESRGIALQPMQLPLLATDDLRNLIAYCHKNNVATTIHAVESSLVAKSIAAGIDRLAHVPFYPMADETIDLIVAKQVAVSTTLAVIKNISRVVRDDSLFDGSLFQAVLSTEDLHHHRVEERHRYTESEMWKWTDSVLPVIQDNARILYDKGVILALGTDRTIGAIAHQELENLVEIGIPPIDAIRIGTLNGAVYLGLQNDLGSIEVGKLADMVLLSADPTVDIKNMASIEKVFKGGTAIDRSQLDLPVNKSP